MNMKKNILFSLLGLGLLILAPSCRDTLDTHPTDFFDEETVWSSYSTANAFINATYASVLNGMWAGSGTAVTWEARTPNTVEADQVTRPSDRWALEIFNRSQDLGANQASRLRRCNLIIEKATASENLSAEEKTVVVAEGKFLRAMVFFYQARTMGRFLPIKQVFSQEDTTVVKDLHMTSSVKESYDIVIADFEDAIAGLPKTSSAGRANKYAAEVLLSSACLQAYAYTGDQAYLNKCITAAKDVVENKQLTTNYAGMFNETDQYNPEILLGYYRLAQNSQMSSFYETQLTAPNITPSQQENSKCPVMWTNKDGQTFCAWGVYWPTQDLVDQYLVIDDKTKEALPWWETSQWKENVDELDPSTVTEPGQVDQYNQLNGNPRRIPSPNDLSNVNENTPTFTRYSVLKADRTDERNISELMYQNRDARFHGSIIADGDVFVGEPFHTNLDGNAGIGVRDKEDGAWYNTATGYYWRKNTIENPQNTYYGSVKIDMHYVIARVGEAYMNLAEAYLLQNNVTEAVKALNATRVTHGKLPESKASTLEEAWEDYMRERNCEMTNEHADMYFTYLRWGKYGGYSNHGRNPGDIIYDLDRATYKMSINRARDAILVGQVTITGAAKRQFTTKRYLFPIHQGFLDTREAYGLDHQQNEGW